MSPEQAEAQNVDERSDIFSFGAVLYEMIAGRRAFSGASRLSTLASVIHADPAPIKVSREQVPRELERIVERCLRKDPRRRWQNMADVKIAIEDVSQEVDLSKAVAQEQSSGARSGHRSWAFFVWLALAVLALGTGAYVACDSSGGSNSLFPAFDIPARQCCRSKIRARRHGTLQRSMGL